LPLFAKLPYLYVARVKLSTMKMKTLISVKLLALLLLQLTTFTVQAQQPDDTSFAYSPGKLRSLSEEALSAGDAAGAIAYLEQAIAQEPNNANNHVRLYKVGMRKRTYERALEAISRAVDLEQQQQQQNDNKTMTDNQRLQAKLLVQLGECERAVQLYATYNDRDTAASHCHALLQQAHDAQSNEDYETALLAYEAAGNYVLPHILAWPRAQALYHTADYYGCIRETGQLLQRQAHFVDAYQLRGACHYKLGEHDSAMAHYRLGLKLDPEHASCKAGHRVVKATEKKLRQASDAFATGDYDAAADLYQAAMNVDLDHYVFLRSTLLLQAKAYSKAGQHDVALEILHQHVDDEETVMGLYALGEAQQDAEQYDDAVRTLARALELVPEDREAQAKLQAAQIALKQSKEKNYYKLLNVKRSATDKEIKKAYRELALRWHPDKVADNEKELGETMFQDIGEAYEVLSNGELRAKYDRGEDVFENQGRQHANPFQQFHHQGGGQQFHFRFQ
jgi:DnaJ family protein C protein 3